MAYLNENYLKLQAGYLFPEIARRVREFSEGNPAAAKRLIRCGIGDVTEPLPAAAVDAMRGSLNATVDYSAFDLIAFTHWDLEHGPFARVSLGPGLTHARAAIQLDPNNAEAYLWLGLSLRKQNKPVEARQAFAKSLELNPNRVWVKQQLDKTPAK